MHDRGPSAFTANGTGADMIWGTGAPWPALRAQHLAKRYASTAEEIAATVDVSLTVGRGELVLIMGPSGSGKTTLLLLCGGLMRPTAGQVWIDGTEITQLDERRLPELRLARLASCFSPPTCSRP